MQIEEEEEIGWAVHVPCGPKETWLTTKPVTISAHATQRVAERFGLVGDEANQFVWAALFAAQTGRRSRGGAVRWTSGPVTLVTHEDHDRLVVVTVCQTPTPQKRVRLKPQREVLV